MSAVPAATALPAARPDASRDAAIARATGHLDSGSLFTTLARRIAIPTESQNPERAPDMQRYLRDEMIPAFEAMGFGCRVLEHAKAQAPFLVAERREGDGLPTVLGYGHGDVIRGQDDRWKPGLSPWTLTERDGVWFGRGVVDNKGQHTLNMAALDAVLATRGRLGFNAKFLIEMGEETGSPGLRPLCEDHAALLAADVLIASDGPRIATRKPTLFLGSRGGLGFDLIVEARAGAHHSGNWGGLISNPGVILAHAIASMVGPKGEVRVPGWVPDGIPDSVRAAIAKLQFEPGPDDPVIEPDWGEPGLTPAERVYAWCSIEVLAFETGNPRQPVNAIPPRAWARMQLRYSVGVDPDTLIPKLRAFLDRQGLRNVRIELTREAMFRASRIDPQHPWVQWAARSIERTTRIEAAILPSLGGSLPNDVFTEVLKLPTLWVPHSYPASANHAPNENVPVSVLREGLAIMAGLYWDLGEPEARDLAAHPVPIDTR
ncbi:MAG TPA: M20 family metallopeptidase [Quisquiliibacterium sp.]|nr:M20 family metallopeptidase [Quisquiliibacterium sp.]